MQIITLLATLALQTAPAGNAPLLPSGKWEVEYADNMCVLSRDYGSGDDLITLGFRPWPMGDTMEVVLITRGGRLPGTSGKGALMLAPAGRTANGTFFGFRTKGGERRVTTLSVPQDGLTGLDAATTLTVTIGKNSATFAPKGIRSALAALKTCSDDLLKDWGVDPELTARIAEPARAIGGPGDWITADNYPRDALRRVSGGRTMLLWTIGVDGRVTNCVTKTTSGDPYLDAAACQAIVRNGRYRPAIDKDGKPIVSRGSRAVQWRVDDP